jgi:hypothetical protein
MGQSRRLARPLGASCPWSTSPILCFRLRSWIPRNLIPAANHLSQQSQRPSAKTDGGSSLAHPHLVPPREILPMSLPHQGQPRCSTARGAMRSSGLALPKTVVHKANARKSARSLVAETGKHGAEDRAMNSPASRPTAWFQEVEKPSKSRWRNTIARARGNGILFPSLGPP